MAVLAVTENPIRFRDSDVQIYADRLADLIELRYKIDHHGFEYPWWAGTVTSEVEGKAVTPLAVNIFREVGVSAPGLRFAVLKGIDGSYGWLCQHGHSNYADACVRFDRNRALQEG